MLRGALRWVVERELLFTVALGPLFIFPGLHTLAGLALVAGLWVARWGARSRVTIRLPVFNPCFLVLLLMLVVSLWVSVELSLSLPMLYRVVWGIALFYAVVNTVRSEAQAYLVVAGLLAVVVILDLISLVGTNWTKTKLIGLPVYEHLPALITDVSDFPGGGFHPNIVAGTLAPFIPLALSLAFSTGRGGRRYIAGRISLALLAALLLSTVLLTQSRGGWLALAVGVLALVLLFSSRSWWLLPISLAGAVIGVLERPALVESFLWRGVSGSGASRVEVWNRALYMIRDMPLTGIGLGTFPVILDAFYPSFLAGPGARIPHAHNVFLQVAVDLGLPGMVAFTAVFVTSLGLAFRAYQRGERRSLARGLGAGVVGALVVVAVHGLFDASLWVARSSPLLWMLLSLGPVARGLAEADQTW